MDVENWLEELDIDEVSLVYDPMNPLSVISIMKSKGKGGEEGDDGDDEESPPFKRVAAIVKEAHARHLARRVLREVFDNFGALRDNLDQTFGNSALTDVQKAKKLATILDEYRESLDKLAPDAAIAKSVAETMASITKGDDPVVILKELSMNATQLAEALAAAEETNAALTTQVAELQKGKDKAEADLKALQGEVTVLKGKLPGASDEDKYAGMPPVVVAKMKDMERDLALANAAIAKGQDDEAIRVKAEFFKGKLVPQPDVVAAAFYRLSKGKGRDAGTTKIDGKDVAVPSDVEIVEQALVAKAAASRVPLRTVGVATGFEKGADEGEFDDAGAALKAKATEIAKGKSISEDAAMVIAMDENPDLYQRYRQQQRRAAAAI